MKNSGKKRLLPAILAAVMTVICAASWLGYKSDSTRLCSQQAAERWRGENELAFAQISCFMAPDDLTSEEEIRQFRTDMAKKLTDASFEVTSDTPLIRDAWSGTGKVKIARGKKSAEVAVTAVGGAFFDFHPIRLVSGNYLSPDDLMEDRVLLDRECAWLLFGGEELSGLEFEINGESFVVAGVIEREDDRFSKRAYTDGMGIYMSWEAYKKLNENAGISCYELVMAEPVKGFVYSAAQEKYPIGSGEIVDNSYRFEPERLLKLVKEPGRSMRMGAAVYPYWENAARAAEDASLRWLLASIAAAVLPVLLALWLVIKGFVYSKGRLEERVPGAKEKLQEAWRVRARARWEKRNPGMK